MGQGDLHQQLDLSLYNLLLHVTHWLQLCIFLNAVRPELDVAK